MKIIESSIIGKKSPEACEDGMVVTDDFIAVIDGSTSKTPKHLNPDMKNGKYAMMLISEYIREELKADASVDDFCQGVTAYIYNKVSSGQFLYVYAVVALLLPNIALCYTECLTPWACGVNVLLPLSLYMLFFSVAKRPGKMIWWAFIFVFFAAFQLVLLYLFGTGVIAVDMFLGSH